jgi:uncharacterized protein involved in type VI secretion and phage assembly
MSWLIEFRKTLADFGLEGFNKYYGSYRGFIVSNDDPLHYGRVTLKVPQVWGSESYDYWAWPKGQFCGDGMGLYAIPDEGNMVWVSFENGNPKFPIWEYGHFSAKNNRIAKAKTPKQKIFQTKNGMALLFDEEKNIIQLYHSDKRVVEISKKGVSLGSENGSGYSALLGEETETVLTQISEVLNTIDIELKKLSATQATASSSSGVLAPLAAGYTALATGLSLINADIGKIKTGITKIKSKLVTLD